MKKTKTRQGIIKAFNAAIEGIIYTFKFEKHKKIDYNEDIRFEKIRNDTIGICNKFSCNSRDV